MKSARGRARTVLVICLAATLVAVMAFWRQEEKFVSLEEDMAKATESTAFERKRMEGIIDALLPELPTEKEITVVDGLPFILARSQHRNWGGYARASQRFYERFYRQLEKAGRSRLILWGDDYSDFGGGHLSHAFTYGSRTFFTSWNFRHGRFYLHCPLRPSGVDNVRENHGDGIVLQLLEEFLAECVRDRPLHINVEFVPRPILEGDDRPFLDISGYTPRPDLDRIAEEAKERCASALEDNFDVIRSLDYFEFHSSVDGPSCGLKGREESELMGEWRPKKYFFDGEKRIMRWSYERKICRVEWEPGPVADSGEGHEYVRASCDYDYEKGSLERVYFEYDLYAYSDE